MRTGRGAGDARDGGYRPPQAGHPEWRRRPGTPSAPAAFHMQPFYFGDVAPGVLGQASEEQSLRQRFRSHDHEGGAPQREKTVKEKGIQTWKAEQGVVVSGGIQVGAKEL